MPVAQTPMVFTGYHVHPLMQGIAPEWTSGWGQDGYGIFVEITVEAVVQRLRWIPPGTFRMGSPETEAGRGDDEGPLHPVTLSQGFWLFDTPVTQELWNAIMGENPSAYQSAKRPVETISWHEANEFIGRVNTSIPGVNLNLPSEAQWEYACRAGTESAIHIGEMEILGENNAPALDAIAWYSGNSGVEFDLENGYDSSAWPEKQYPHKTAGTRKVAHKAPNPWGLYDMLGNVYEWCLDGQRSYTGEVPTDPHGSLDDDAGRVVRGGSWSDGARGVRSAYRFAFDPGVRFNFLGFRCARVQDSEKAEPDRAEAAAQEAPS